MKMRRRPCLVVETLTGSCAIESDDCEMADDQAFGCCCLSFRKSRHIARELNRSEDDEWCPRTDYVQICSVQAECVGKNVDVFVDNGL